LAMDKAIAACIKLGSNCCLFISDIVSIALIVIGSVNTDKCPVEPMIPTFLIVTGTLSIAASIVSCCGKICDKENEIGIRVQPIPCQVVNVLMTIAKGIWFILGMMWTLRANPTYQPGMATYCDWFTYMVAYVTFIIIFIVLGLAWCFCECGTALMREYSLNKFSEYVLGLVAEPKSETEADSSA
ncbi:hypothetical protein PRIPAC_78297, partial [Pristionchus pacificus]|uniref:Uncharacterized protein n=1 Tax=Pristionchus pacificus TaxID=54126 RepID=A0A2A6CLN6_PRIPA